MQLAPSVLRLLAAALIAAFSAVAGAQPAGPTLWLVLVDVSQHEDARLVPNPAHKALVDGVEAFHRAVPEDAPPFARRTIWRLSPAGEARTQPRRENIEAAFANPEWGLRTAARSGDCVLFYFAGNLTTVEGLRWLVVQDTRADAIAQSALSMDRVEEWMESLRSAGVDAHAFVASEAASTAPVAATPAARPPAPGTIEGTVIFDAPPAGRNTTHRVVIQDDAGKQTYLTWQVAVTNALSQENRPRIGARLAVTTASTRGASDGTVSVDNAAALRVVGAAPQLLWPRQIEIGMVDPSLAHQVITIEGRVARATPNVDPAPNFLELAGDGPRRVTVVMWDHTEQRLHAEGKTPAVGDTVRLTGLVQLYDGRVQVRFDNPEYMTIVSRGR